MKRHMIYMALACTALSAMAQEKLEGTMYVEGEYVPTIVRQDKIHLLPQKVSFELPSLNPQTSRSLLTGDYSPAFSALPAPVWRGELAGYPWRGYLDLGLGSYLNSTLSAGYRLADTEKMTADIWLQHNSTSLFHPRTNEYTRNWKRYAYDERIGLNFGYDFGNSGLFNASLGYHLGLFNYYGAASLSPDNEKAPSQTLNDALLRLRWQSVDNGTWRFGLRAEGGYFGYRRFYNTDSYANWIGHKGQSETQASAGATIGAHIAAGQLIEADIDFTNLSYNNASDTRSRSLQTLRLLPAYTFSGDRFSIRLGAVLDFAWGAGRSLDAQIPDRDYSTLHAAPSIKLAYNAGTWGVTLSATGGQRLQTLRSGYELDYYQRPLVSFVLPAFLPIEGKARVEIRPSTSFHAGADITYASVRHLYMGGWYMTELSDCEPDYLDIGRTHGNLSGYSIGVDAEWSPADIVTFSGRGTYQPQRSGSTTGFFNGYDRPRWIVDARAEVRPVNALSLTLGYSYRGVRNIFRCYGETPDGEGVHLPDICNLRLGARYRITRALSIYGSADNLLGRRVQLLPGQKMEGFNFLLGADIIF